MSKKILLCFLLLTIAAVSQTKVKVLSGAGAGNPPNVQLSWGASTTQAVSYNIYASSTAGGEQKPVLANVQSGTVFTDTTLAFGTSRFYNVRACSGCKPDGTGGAESTPTNEVSVQIPLQPAPPGTLQTPIVVYP